MTLHFLYLAQLSVIAIAAVPYITAWLTKAHLKRWQNELIALTVSLVAGVIAFLQAGFTFANVNSWDTLGAACVVIFAGAKLYYKKLAAASPLLTDFKTPKPLQDLATAYLGSHPDMAAQVGALETAATAGFSGVPAAPPTLHLHVTSSFTPDQLGAAAPAPVIPAPVIPAPVEMPAPEPEAPMETPTEAAPPFVPAPSPLVVTGPTEPLIVVPPGS